MTTEADTRIPLWALTDRQLREYADDDLVEWGRRQTAAMILRDREKERTNALVGVTEDDGA